MRIYSHNLESRIKSLKNDKSLSEENKEIILKFIHACDVEGLSDHRILKYIGLLKQICIMMNRENIANAEREDIENVLLAVRKKTESEETRHDYAVTLKKFYRWLNDGKEPEITQFFKATKKKSKKKLPEDLLTEDEVNKMIEATRNTRDQALIAVLWDTGARIGEIATLRIKHVTFDEHGATIIVHGKTGYRRVRIVPSLQYLMRWIEMHPYRDNPEAPLWYNMATYKDSQPMMSYAAIRKQIRKIAKKAGINKKIHAHLFRHSRATHMANYLTEAQMNVHFGWVQGSDMPSTYVHLSGRDVDKAILKAHGIKYDEEKEMFKNKPHICPRCRAQNNAQTMFCFRCGAALTIEVALELEEKAKPLDEKITQIMKNNIDELVEAKINEILRGMSSEQIKSESK